MSEKSKRERQISTLVQGISTKRKRGQASTPSEAPEETQQISAFIPKSLYKRIKIHLINLDDDTTLTEVIVDALRKWSEEQGI